jgi:hypothetical protein
MMRILIDNLADDSDKTFVVPTSRAWHVLWIFVQLVSNGSVGNRNMRVMITDEADALQYQIDAGAVQAATLTERYSFFPGAPRGAAFTNNQIEIPIPPGLYLKPGWKVRVLDSAAVAAAADDMNVSIAVNEYDPNFVSSTDLIGAT